jgi:tRNA A37 N6-isopentenylltransferase MiaA
MENLQKQELEEKIIQIQLKLAKRQNTFNKVNLRIKLQI